MMEETRLEVRAVAPYSMDAWRAMDRSPAPTFQARPIWALALADANRGLEPAPQACTFADGSICVVPMVRSRRSLGWAVFSGTPLGGYTVALEADGSLAAPARARASFSAVLASAGHSVTITPWPLAPGDPPDLRASATQHETAVIDLGDGAAAALARMDGKCRRMAGQAERRGVRCVRATQPDAVDRYYAMLEESALRWGRKRPTFPKRLLEALVAHGGEAVEIWFAEHQGEAIAGGVMLYGGEEANFWSAAMRSDFGTLRPSNALNVALIGAAAARGVRWYNLGSSEGLPGVARFKEGLGAQTVRYVTWKHERRAYSVYRSLRALATRRKEE